VYTCIIIFQQDIGTKYSLYETLRNRIEGATFDGDDTLEDIGTINELLTW